MGSKNAATQRMENILKNIYYDVEHPASFSGVLKLSKAGNVPIKKTKEWLMTQDVYTLHKPVRYKFQRRKVLSYGIGDLIQCDLVDLSKFARYNKGMKYLLTAIDVFSKYAYAIPLKSKSAGSVLSALKKLFEKVGGRIKHFQTDSGREYINNSVKRFLKEKGVNHYVSHSEYKASVIERFNRTLKNKLYRIFTYRNSFKYIDVLDSVLKSYNDSIHRSIKLRPSQVTPRHESVIFERLYGYQPIGKYDLFRVGDQVRISKAKKTFKRGYLPNWTEEVFKIFKCFSEKNPPTFLLEDLKGNVIKGRFYAHELQKVTKTAGDYWRVEKILKTRGKGKEKEYFVKWKGYGPEYNSWVKSIRTIGVERGKK